MIIKYSPTRLLIIFSLVILFPLVQKQWLNLSLFDTNNFTIYKILYYLSGIICPILVIIYSLNNYTYYKLNNRKANINLEISGKSLFFISSAILFILSILIFIYIFINLRISLNLFSINNKILDYYNFNNQLLIIVVISILLIFKKLKIFVKKVTLINFFIMSIIIWYSEISNRILNDALITDIFKLENISFFNLLFLLLIEVFYYLWSYISYGSYLSDWKIPRPCVKKEVASIANIIFFYLLIILYYALLLN